MAKVDKVLCDKCGRECVPCKFVHFETAAPPLAHAGQDVCYICIGIIVTSDPLRETPLNPYIYNTQDGSIHEVHPVGCRCHLCDAR